MLPTPTTSFLSTRSAWISPSGEVFPCTIQGRAWAVFDNTQLSSYVPWLQSAKIALDRHKNHNKLGSEDTTAFSNTLLHNLNTQLYKLGFICVCYVDETSFEVTGASMEVITKQLVQIRALLEEYQLHHDYPHALEIIPKIASNTTFISAPYI